MASLEARDAAVRPAVNGLASSRPDDDRAESAPPRATALQIRDVILRGWNALMPEGLSSRALFGIDPVRLASNAPAFGGKADRIRAEDGRPKSSFERRLD